MTLNYLMQMWTNSFWQTAQKLVMALQFVNLLLSLCVWPTYIMWQCLWCHESSRFALQIFSI